MGGKGVASWHGEWGCRDLRPVQLASGPIPSGVSKSTLSGLHSGAKAMLGHVRYSCPGAV